jgi:hypothetical protein
LPRLNSSHSIRSLFCLANDVTVSKTEQHAGRKVELSLLSHINQRQIVHGKNEGNSLTHMELPVVEVEEIELTCFNVSVTVQQVMTAIECTVQWWIIQTSQLSSHAS